MRHNRAVVAVLPAGVPAEQIRAAVRTGWHRTVEECVPVGGSTWAVVARGEPAAVINDSKVVEGYLGTSEAAIRRSGSTQGKPDGAKRPRRRRQLVAQR